MQNKLENGFWQTRVKPFLVQHKAVVHFVLAIFISALLHLYIVRNFWHVLFKPPAPINAVRIIEAKLIATTPLKKAEKKPLATRTVKSTEKKIFDEPIKKSPPPPPQNIAPDVPILATELPVIAETNNAAVSENSVISEAVNENPQASENVSAPTVEGERENAESTQYAQKEEAALNRAKAYQYVETHFDVFTDAASKTTRTPAGTAEMVYQALENGSKYQIKNAVSPKGLASLIIPGLLQTSAGAIIDQGLQPHAYLYQFGSKKNKTNRADFDWTSHTLTLENAKGTQTLALTDDTQDLLSFMYQFMFTPPLNETQIKITNGKKLSIVDYNFDGEEILETKLGKINTVHLSHDAIEREEKTEIWLAVDYRYLPVKIRKMEKNDKVYEMLVNTIKTDLGSLTSPQIDTPTE